MSHHFPIISNFKKVFPLSRRGGTFFTFFLVPLLKPRSHYLKSIKICIISQSQDLMEQQYIVESNKTRIRRRKYNRKRTETKGGPPPENMNDVDRDNVWKRSVHLVSSVRHAHDQECDQDCIEESLRKCPRKCPSTCTRLCIRRNCTPHVSQEGCLMSRICLLVSLMKKKWGWQWSIER